MQRVRASRLELTLQVGESDVEVDHGHLGGGMAEEFHQCGKIDTTAKQFAGVGVSELMRDDASGDARGGGNFMQIGAELADEHLPGTRPCQQTTVLG